MSDQAYSWDRFRLEVFIRCQPEQAFQAWGSSQGIKAWFRNDVRVNRNGAEVIGPISFRAGDEIQWADYEGQDLAPSKILEVRENTFIKQTFDSKSVVLTNEFKRLEGGTLLTLTQENMPTDPNGIAAWHLTCCAGWTFFLTNLKSVLEHGTDLREQKPDLTFQVAKYIYDESWKSPAPH